MAYTSIFENKPYIKDTIERLLALTYQMKSQHYDAPRSNTYKKRFWGSIDNMHLANNQDYQRSIVSVFLRRIYTEVDPEIRLERSIEHAMKFQQDILKESVFHVLADRKDNTASQALNKTVTHFISASQSKVDTSDVSDLDVALLQLDFFLIFNASILNENELMAWTGQAISFLTFYEDTEFSASIRDVERFNCKSIPLAATLSLYLKLALKRLNTESSSKVKTNKHVKTYVEQSATLLESMDVNNLLIMQMFSASKDLTEFLYTNFKDSKV